MEREETMEKLISEREKIDWRSIISSAIKNPQNQIANFEELKEKAIKVNKGSEEKIIFENEKVKLIFKIRWDKDKFFFSYENTVVNKMSNEKNKRVIGTNDAHNHNSYRHLPSGDFIIPNPETLLEKIEHPILSLIINSEIQERKAEWINRLAEELKDSQINWVKYTFKK